MFLKLIVNCLPVEALAKKGQLLIVLFAALFLFTIHSPLLTNDAHAQVVGCTLSVTPTTIAPHGTFSVNVQNAQPGVEYAVVYDFSSYYNAITPISTRIAFQINVDQIFGASSPQASSGSFTVAAGTSVPEGFPTANGIGEQCTPKAGLTVTIDPALYTTPPYVTPPYTTPPYTTPPYTTPPYVTPPYATPPYATPPYTTPPYTTPPYTTPPTPPTGNIDANPTVCQVPNAGSSCQSTISWTTTNVTSASICASDVAVGNEVPLLSLIGASGSRTLTFNSGITYRLSLYATGNCTTLLDSVTVTALAPPPAYVTPPYDTPPYTTPTGPPPIFPGAYVTPFGTQYAPSQEPCVDWNTISFNITKCFQPAQLAGNRFGVKEGFGNLASDILIILTSIAASLSVIFIVIAGIKFVTSGGDPKNTAQARMTLTYAIIGIIVTILSFIILRIVELFLRANVPGL